MPSTPASGPAAALQDGAVDLCDRRSGGIGIELQVDRAETLAVGTRIAVPSSLPNKLRQDLSPTAFAAPVEVGISDVDRTGACAAQVADAACQPCSIWSPVKAWIVVM